MSKRLFVTLVVLIALAGLFSCGDDDCPTCPPTAQKAVAWGITMVDDSSSDLFFYSLAYGLDGRIPQIDSVTYDGNLTEAFAGFAEFGSAVYAVYNEDPTLLDSGDTVEVKYYLPSGTSTARVKLLDSDYDEPTVLSHATNYPYDTVALNDEVTVVWRAVPNADFYTVFWDYDYDSSGTRGERLELQYLATNSFEIPVNTLAYNGRIYFDVYAVTGPRPDIEAGNINGSVIKGNIASVVGDYFDLYVGTGVLPPSSPPRQEPQTPRETVEAYMHLMK